MSILIHPPVNRNLPYIDWSLAVVGKFYDHSPPNTSFVFNIVNNHWEVHAPIRIYRMGPYFLFECKNSRDTESLLTLNTTFIDGNHITFRPSSEQQIPASVNFNMARI